jgi:hypothetical protein
MEVWVMTDKNYAYFREHLDELIEQFRGKHGEQVIALLTPRRNC